MDAESKKGDKDKKVLAYVNIHKRTINLAKLGFLEEIKSDSINIHSRRDFKVTERGLEQLVPYFRSHPENYKELLHYMEQIKLDVNIIIKLMMDDAAMSMNSTNVLLNEAEKASMIHQISEKFNGSQRIREFIKYDHPDPFFEQQRAKLNRLARNEPEIEDHELEEDLNRMNQRSRRTTITKQSQSHRSKRQQKLKVKAH